MGEDIEVIGDHDPEIEEMIREARREESYFNNPDESHETHVEQISQMEKDPVMSLLTGE